MKSHEAMSSGTVPRSVTASRTVDRSDERHQGSVPHRVRPPRPAPPFCTECPPRSGGRGPRIVAEGDIMRGRGRCCCRGVLIRDRGSTTTPLPSPSLRSGAGIFVLGPPAPGGAASRAAGRTSCEQSSAGLASLADPLRGGQTCWCLLAAKRDYLIQGRLDALACFFGCFEDRESVGVGGDVDGRKEPDGPADR